MTMPSPPPPEARDRLARDRTDYHEGRLGDDAPADPTVLFDAWLTEAFARRDSHGDLPEPSAVVLSTVELLAEGTPQPRSRTVLLKGRDERGFVFYTNLESAKGRELAAVPRGAMLLPWLPLQRQVRIEGGIERVDDATADDYFAQRPRGAQIGAWASQQSAPIGSREELEERRARAEQRFSGAGSAGNTPVPRPPHWGGLRLVAERFEFWQGRPDRLHDRIVYQRPGLADGGETAWEQFRLQP